MSDASPIISAPIAPGPSLPAPFDDVRFCWDVSDRFIELEYIGLAARLIECGAIEAQMAEKTPKGGPKPRRDSAGHRFDRQVRIARQPALAAVLRVTRYICDIKFAETLPGVPRGLRMKRLDWLDAHPGAVHVIEERGEKYVQTASAGTRESLIAAGFPRSYLGSKLLQRSASPEVSWMDGKIYTVVRSLMRGYLEVRTQCAVPPCEEEAKTSPAPRPHLRLVVDNTAPRDSETSL